MIPINIKELKEQVPDVVFKQGLEYYKNDKVKITNWDNSSVIASVIDEHPYVVRLSSDERSFESVCTCSYSHICKHAVAAALAIIEDHVREDDLVEGSNWREYFEKQIAIQQVNTDFSQEVRWKLIYVVHILEKFIGDGASRRRKSKFHRLNIWKSTAVPSGFQTQKLILTIFSIMPAFN